MGEKASTEPSRAGRGQLGIWVSLVIVLSLLGVAGAESYAVLQQVTRTPTVTDIAERVCTAYTTQNYQLLISQIDPSPIAGSSTLPSGVSSSGPFNTTAKNELISELKTLDVSFGPVISCQQHQLVYSGTAPTVPKVQFIFVMHRSSTPKVTYSCLMNFVQYGGGWMITRDSNFTGTPS
ncbi:MAG: hypothetical protein ACLQUY_13920 [Ktedonobacterales bacterium]